MPTSSREDFVNGLLTVVAEIQRCHGMADIRKKAKP